jgi:hypothetical protein
MTRAADEFYDFLSARLMASPGARVMDKNDLHFCRAMLKPNLKYGILKG